MKKQEWPLQYPEELKEVSWCLENKCAGPNRWYVKALPETSKHSRLFIKNVLIDWFKSQGIAYSFANEWCQWITERITVWLGFDEGEFIVGWKKDKDKNPIFNKNEYVKMSEQTLGLKDAESLVLLTSARKYLKEYYTRMI